MIKRLSILICSGLFLVLCGLFLQYRVAHTAHLRLDQRTSAVFQNATRVEVYRLADFEESRYFTDADQESIKKLNKQFEDYTVVRVGKEQDRPFAASLAQAFALADDSNTSTPVSCFDPGVAYRIWSGEDCVDISICFYCSGIDIVTRNAQNQVVSKELATLGEARGPLLMLSRKAFPNDAGLKSLQD